jgi:hypothetical protein
VDVFDFALEIVVPTVKEALADRGNRRRAYIASIVTYSLIDHIAAAIKVEKTKVCDSLRNVCTPAFEVVQGVCNGTKHSGKTRGFSFEPGTDRAVPVFAFDVPGAGWDQGRWGSQALAFRETVQNYFWILVCRLCFSTCAPFTKLNLGASIFRF